MLPTGVDAGTGAPQASLRPVGLLGISFGKASSASRARASSEQACFGLDSLKYLVAGEAFREEKLGVRKDSTGVKRKATLGRRGRTGHLHQKVDGPLILERVDTQDGALVENGAGETPEHATPRRLRKESR